jgi:hypothetical protein
MIKKRIKRYTLKAKNEASFPIWFIVGFWKLGPKYYVIIEYLGNYASIRFNDLLHAIMVIQAMKELDEFYLEEGSLPWSVDLGKSSLILQKVSNCKRRIMNEAMLGSWLRGTWTEIKKLI